MRIIDFHNHVYPEKIAQKATEAVGAFYDCQVMERTGTVEELIASHRAAGIDICVVHAVATTAQQVQRVNDFVALTSAESNGSIYAYGSLQQDYENKIDELKRCISLGLKGIKLHPDTQLLNVDDDSMLEAYDYMQGKLPLLLHAGDFRYDYSHPRRIRRICQMFPRLQVIGAHFGGWSVWEEAKDYLYDMENCLFDTSSTSGFVGMERFEKLVRSYGADRLLFGSDFPMWDAKEELERFMSIPLTEEEREKILYSNAAKLLGIE